MAKGKAAHSASGASMSKYDVEVESRLQALESQAHPDRACTDDGDGDLAERVSIIEAVPVSYTHLTLPTTPYV